MLLIMLLVNFISVLPVFTMNVPRQTSKIGVDDSFVEQGDRSCAPYDCWNSQLLDLSRDTLINIFNDYKAAIAQKKCERCAHPDMRDFGTVFQMNYHWMLEFAALHYQRANNKTCKFQHQAWITIDDLPADVHSPEQSLGSFREFGRRDRPMEYSSTSFKLRKNEDQTIAIEKFKHFMSRDRKYNLFEAWNGIEYRYTLATEFGCTLTIRNNVTGVTAIKETVSNARVAYLACVFAFEHIENDTNIPKALLDPRTKLFYYPQFQENIADDIPCQFYYNIPKKSIFPNCKQTPPRIWQENDAPNPRHQKINIKIANSAVLEVAVASGLTKIKSVERKEQESNFKSPTTVIVNYKENSDSSVDFVPEEIESEIFDNEEEKTKVNESDYVFEYVELVDESTTEILSITAKLTSLTENVSFEVIDPQPDVKSLVFSTTIKITTFVKQPISIGRNLLDAPSTIISDVTKIEQNVGFTNSTMAQLTTSITPNSKFMSRTSANMTAKLTTSITPPNEFMSRKAVNMTAKLEAQMHDELLRHFLNRSWFQKEEGAANIYSKRPFDSSASLLQFSKSLITLGICLSYALYYVSVQAIL